MMQLFNINTGQYVTPELHTWNEFKAGKRTFLSLCTKDIFNHPEAIERYFNLKQDIKKDATNERYSIYEIAANHKYVLIHKKDGELVNIAIAQNCLSLLLKYVK